MKLSLLRYIFLSAILFSSLCIYSQVRIHGKVYDSNNQPLEFVTVRISGTVTGTTTGLKGEYSLTCAEQDTIKLVFSCIGYKEAERRLIGVKGEIVVNQQLQSKTTELAEVEVSDFKKQLGGMQTIGASSYKFSPDVSGGSVESLITTMAGVSSSNEMSSQYSVHGGSFDENSIYINGIELYRPLLVTTGEQEGLSVINPHMVDKIEFSTGGFPAEYSDKMSSALSITYRQPEAFEGSAGVSFMGANLAIGQSSGRFSQLHGLRYKRNNSILSSLETKGEYDPNFFDYQTNLNYRVNAKWKVSFLGNIAVNNYKFKPVNRTTNFGTAEDAKQFTVYFDGNEKDKFETYFGAMALQYRPNKSNDITFLASGYLTNELVTYDISGEYWLDQAGTTGDDGNGIGGELGVGRYHEHARNRIKASVFSLALRGNSGINSHNLSYGITYNREKVYERSREWELRDSAGFSLPSEGESLEMIYLQSSRQDISTNRISVFAQDSYRLNTPTGYLAVNGGVRLSYWDFNKELLVSPRLGVSYIPSKADQWVFRFATGLYYQSPFYKEYRRPSEDGTVIELNHSIKSQRSWQFIVGADYTFRMLNRPFKLSGETYYKVLSNLIPYEVDNLKVVYSGVNGSTGFTAGLDFKLFGQFVPGSDSWISFSLMKTQETLNGVKVPRPNDRRYSFAMYFTDYFPKFPKLKLNLRGVFSDGLPTTAPHSTRDKGYFRTPAYKRVDVGLSYALVSPPKDGMTRSRIGRYLKSVWLGVDCFNLFDISNVSSYYWVTDVNDVQYAVPNYLTRRQINISLTVDF